MFDDQQPSQKPNTPEPEDIFAPPSNLPTGGPVAAPVEEATPSSAPSSVPKPAPPTISDAPSGVPPTPPPVQPASRHSSGGSGVVKAIAAVLIALAIIGVAAFLAYKMIMAAPGDDVSDEENAGAPVVDTSSPPANTPEPEPTPMEDKDSDGDGLTDAEENRYGTDALLADTDSDLLGDREEVRVFGTDPLDPDTDKDGFTDGSEVENGYNPNGPGKLIELPTAQK